MLGRLAIAACAGVLVLSGCGGDGGNDPDEASPSAEADQTGDVGADDGGGLGGDDDAGNAAEADEGASSPATDPAELAGRIQQAGLGCDDYAATEPEPGGPDLKGVCTLSSGKTITIDVLLSEARWQEYTGMAEIVCSYVPGQEFANATGEWWAISADGELEGDTIVFDNETTTQIADAIDAELVTTQC